MSLLTKICLGAAALAIALPALANPCPPGNPPTNCAPPTGAILDLDGTAIPHQYRQYTTSFVASEATTNLSFAFRNDPAFLSLDDVVLSTGGGSNLLVNGGFESGVVGSSPFGWSFLNTFGAAYAGVVGNLAGSAHSGSNYYVDGAVQAYDGITQSVATIVGATYNLSFWLTDNSDLSTFSRVSTNGNVSGIGGNGIDLLVYAGAIPTLPVPEPETYALMMLGLAAIGVFSRRRKG